MSRTPRLTDAELVERVWQLVNDAEPDDSASVNDFVDAVDEFAQKGTCAPEWLHLAAMFVVAHRLRRRCEVEAEESERWSWHDIDARDAIAAAEEIVTRSKGDD